MSTYLIHPQVARRYIGGRIRRAEAKVSGVKGRIAKVVCVSAPLT